MQNKIEIYASPRPIWLRDGAVELRIVDRATCSLATITLERMEEGAAMPPTITIPTEQAQALIDQLWTCGLRPSEGAGSAGSLLATQEHLKDLKKIAFHALKINETT